MIVETAKNIEEKNVQAKFESTLKTISKQSSIVFIGKIGLQIVGFFSSILLARMLGANLLGRYQLGLVIIQILSNLSVMGFDRGLVRFIPIFNLHNTGKSKKLLKDNFVISLTVSCCLGILIFIYSPFIATKFFHSIEMIIVLKYFSFFLPILTVFNLGIASFRGLKRADIGSNIENLFAPTLFIAFLFLALLIEGKIAEVIIFRIISRVLGIGCIAYFLLKNFSPIFQSKSNNYNLKEYFSYSSTLLFITLTYFIIGKINILMLGYFLEESQVGIYYILVFFAALNVFGLQAVNTIFAPHVAELFGKKDHKNLEKLFKVLTKWIFYFSLFVFCYITIFKSEILRIYGDSFATGTNALVILAFGQLINALTGSTGAMLLMSGKQKWEVLNSSSILVLNVVLNLVLIPKYGIDGAAIAHTVSISTINILKILETYKEFKMHPYSVNYLKGILTITLGSAIVYFIYQFLLSYDLNYIILLAIGGILLSLFTILGLFLLKFDEEDKIILRKIGQKLNLKILKV